MKRCLLFMTAIVLTLDQCIHAADDDNPIMVPQTMLVKINNSNKINSAIPSGLRMVNGALLPPLEIPGKNLMLPASPVTAPAKGPEDTTPAIPTAQLNQETFNFFLSHKLYVTGSIAGALYLYYFVKLMRGHWSISNNHGWASWKHYLSLQSLAEYEDQEAVIKELVDTIHNTYKQGNSNNFFYPFVRFMADVEREQEQLQNYIGLASAIENSLLKPLFPTQTKGIAHAQQKLERLMYIKALVIEWSTPQAARFATRTLRFASTRRL